MTKREIELEAKHAVNAALELFQRKWLLRVVWELHQGPKTFRALQQACDDLSPTVVNSRLGDLREAGLVELLPGRGYALTALGTQLVEAFLPLMRWGVRWQRALHP